MPRFVIIENRAGESYAVLPADFEKGAEADYKGFHVVSWEDGEKYEGPKTASAIAKAQDAPSAPQKGADRAEKAEG